MYKVFRETCERLLRIPGEPVSPDAAAVSARVFRAAPAYYTYRLVLWALSTAFIFGLTLLVLGGLVATLLNDRGVPGFVRGLIVLIALLVLLLLVGHAVFSLAVVRLDFEKRWYVVTDRSLRIREGVVTVREMTVTFANIQNVAVMQGPIQRALGLADVKVETAGGGVSHGSEKQLGPNLHIAWFRGIDNAEEVRALIQERLRKLKDAGLGDHDDHHEVAASASAAVSGSLLEALRAVHSEACALRSSAASRAS